MHDLSPQYWDQRYLNDEFTWDIGRVSLPLQVYIDQLSGKNLRILIPGAGNAYEAEYLWNLGFEQVDVLDFAPAPLDNIRGRIPGFPQEQLLLRDFFEHRGQYDLILEQTFFCALDPRLRKDYVQQMLRLLRPGGKLAGLLFNDALNADRPPFGGFRAEYEALFFPAFERQVFAPCCNSIRPREGRELFMILRKPA